MQAKRLAALAAAVTALVAVGPAAPAATKDVAPFLYTFQVRSLTVEGKATPHFPGATVAIRLHLARPSRIRSIAWRGKQNSDPNNGLGSAGVPLIGTMVFTDADDPTCSRTVNIKPSDHEILSLLLANARDKVVTHPYLSVGVSGYPLELDNKGGGSNPPKCGYPFRDEGGVTKNYALSVLRKPALVLNVAKLQRIPDVGTIAWTVKMTVKRIKYKPLS